MFKTVSRRLKNAWHNIVIHPIVGVLYLLGFEKAGDWLHGEGPRVEAAIGHSSVDKVADQKERFATLVNEIALIDKIAASLEQKSRKDEEQTILDLQDEAASIGT